MRACVIHAAHDLRVEEVDEVPVGAGEVEVTVHLGGICGSDLHYWRHGGVGDFVLREPMVLGHEVVGSVRRVGDGVDGLRVGQRVAVHPARPCLGCHGCYSGHHNRCTDVRFLGSAARFPHVQGGFRERVVATAAQIVPLPDHLTDERAVFAEPLAVALHAAGRAGDLLGQRVLVTGAGPIGVLIAMAARRSGASQVLVTDLADEPLAVARRAGATEVLNVADPATAGSLPEFDVAIEASGAPPALGTCVEHTRRGGRLVLVGLLPPGTVPMLGNRIVTKELEVAGSFRFDDEFRWALDALADGLDVGPLHSATLPLSRAPEAFELAGDRRQAMKVQLDLS